MTKVGETREVKITQQDIKNGVRYSWDHCPIALAVKREFKAESVHIGDGYATVSVESKVRNCGECQTALVTSIYKLSTEGRRFYTNFDGGHTVSPTTITLTKGLV